MEIFKIILESAGAIALLASGAYGLARILLQQLFAKELEAYKSQLQADASQNLERLKTDLSSKAGQHLEILKAELQAKNARDIEAHKSALGLDTLEHEVRFKRLHDLMINKIIDLFEAIQATHRAILNIAWDSDGITQEKLAAAAAAVNQMQNVLQSNKLFIPKDAFDLVNEFTLKIRPAIIGYHIARTGYERTPAGGVDDEKEADKRVREAGPMLEEIHAAATSSRDPPSEQSGQITPAVRRARIERETPYVKRIAPVERRVNS